MIEGRTVHVITKVFSRDAQGRSTAEMIERSVRVQKFKQYLPAKASRRQDIIQFWDKKGKLHTVAAEDIVL
jgi:hypothetical protein